MQEDAITLYDTALRAGISKRIREKND